MKNFLKIIYIIVIISILQGILVQCGDKKKKREPQANNRTELKQTQYGFDNPPLFRKDGELNFVDKETGNIILKIDIEVASTEIERAMGLMFRPEMDENKGMLFLMDREETQSFYMRNTLIPLDIIYVNSKFEIIDIYKNTETLNDKSLPSAFPAKYVVEINAGLCDKYGIKAGDSIYF